MNINFYSNKNSIFPKKAAAIKLLLTAIILLVFNCFNNVLAQVTITAPSLTLTACTVFPTNSRTLGTIYITENSADDISGSGTLILETPANFEFTNEGTASVTGTEITGLSVSLTNAASITVSFSVASLNELNTLTLSGIQIRGINGASATNNIIRTGGTSIINGDANGTVHAALTSLLSPDLNSSFSPPWICSGAFFNYTPSSSTPNSAFAWTRNAVAGIAEPTNSGYGNPFETLTNISTDPVNVIYNYTVSNNGCTNPAPFSVALTINPAPSLNSSLTPPAICNGTAFNYLPSSSITGTSFAWTRAASAGISNAASSGFGDPGETLFDTTAAPANVNYVYTLSANGCTNPLSYSVAAVINPTPALNSSFTPPAICSGTMFNYSPASGTPGTSFAWTRAAVTGISNLAGNGTGNPNETLINTAVNSINVTYVYTLSADGCINSTSCSVVVTVKPKPVLGSSLTPPSICSGSAFNYTPSSGTPSASFAWSRAVMPGISNAAASGSDNPNEALINTTTAVINAAYVYTISANGCVNPGQNVLVAVNPTPALSSILTPPAICNTTIFSYTPTSATAGASFAWTRAITAGISNAAGNGNGDPNETLTNTTAASINAVYIYSVTANGCTDPSSYSVIVTVIPTVVAAASPLSQTICSGNTFTTNLTSNVYGTVFTWTLTQFMAIGGTANSGTQISDILTSTGAAPGNVIYAVIPTAGTCVGAAVFDTITVKIIPTLSSSLVSPTICSGDNFHYAPASGTTGASFAWTRSIVTGISNTPGSGSGDPNEVLINTTAESVNATYIYTVSANSCTNTTVYNLIVSVNPSPVLSSTLTPPEIFTGNYFSYIPTSVTSGSSFNWTRDAVAGISNTAGSGIDNPNEILINTTGSAINVTYIYTLSANGCTNALAGSVVVTVNSIAVWPGDTDNDSLVNNTDLLSIGLYYSQSGAARASFSDTWQAYPSNNWDSLQTNGQDIKHADCNGDGSIDDNDTMAINLNFNLTHAITPQDNNNNIIAARTTSEMYFVISGSIYNAGDWVDAEVWLGKSDIPVSNLYGIAFNINYDASLVQPGTESITYPSSWLGTPGSDAIKISKIDRPANTAYGAMTRTDHANANGLGKIADFKFQIKTSLTAKDTMYLSFSNYKANDAAGAALAFTEHSDSIALNQTLGINELNIDAGMIISPNPFTSQTTISFTKEIRNASILILDIAGKQVKSFSFSGNQLIFEKGQLDAGLYFVQVVSEKIVIGNKRIVIQ